MPEKNRHNGCTFRVNLAFTRCMGYTQQDLMGSEPWSVLREASKSLMSRLMVFRQNSNGNPSMVGNILMFEGLYSYIFKT